MPLLLTISTGRQHPAAMDGRSVENVEAIHRTWWRWLTEANTKLMSADVSGTAMTLTPRTTNRFSRLIDFYQAHNAYQ